MDATTDILGKAAYYYKHARPFIPMYIHLLISALLPIYTGAHASLSRPSSAAKSTKKEKPDDEDEEEERAQKMEGLTPQDAIIFPITAGIVLAGLYWLIKRYGATIINLILGWYFAAIGVYSVGKLVNDLWTVVDSFLSPTYYLDRGQVWRLSQKEKHAIAVSDGELRRASPLPGLLGRLPIPGPIASLLWAIRGISKDKFVLTGYMKDFFDFKAIVTRHNVISTILGSSAVLYANLVAKPWWLTNIQGFAVCYGALQLMSPTTFATGSLILGGLFAYDIWAVFFTPLMVTVAKNLDVPIKMVFPRPEEPSEKPGEPPIQSYSMLGLGDIVLPGIMIALALRFDLWRFYLQKQKKMTKADGQEEVEKAPYISATGHWGDKMLLFGSRSALLPQYLTSSFPKTYFTASMIGYVIGMLTTLVAMSVSQHAQPALLYLVPGVLISLWGTGLVRGELKQMWDFSEAITAETIDDEETDKAQTDKKADEVETSTWAWVWRELFGTSLQEEKASKTDAATSEAASEKDKSSKTKDTRPDDMVFSINVSRHLPGETKQSTSAEAVNDKGAISVTKPSNSSDSSLSDTIVVSRPEINVAQSPAKKRQKTKH